MRGIQVSAVGRVCSVVLSSVLLAGPVLNAGPAFASEGAATSVGTEAAPDDTTATAEPGFEPGEIVSRRTETATHWQMADGTVRAEIAVKPIRFLDDGAWRPIVTDLVPDAGPGTYVTASTSMTAEFSAPGTQDAPVALSTDDYRLSMDYVGGERSPLVVMGDTARYVGVAPSTDLEYRALRDGIKETVVLGSASAPARHEFEIGFQGLELRRDALGVAGFYRSGHSEPELVIGDLVVFDSSRDDESDEPAYCRDVTMTVEATGPGRARVSYEVSRAWLEAPERVFPVHVDPTYSRDIDTFVSSAFPSTTYNSSEELKCGYYENAGHNRTYVRFDTDSIMPGSTVTDTNFKIRQFHQYYTSTATTTYLGRLTGSFGTGSTWNSQNSVVGDPQAKCDMRRSKSVTGRDVDVNWDIDDIVQSWVNSPSANKGLLLYQSETSSQNTTHWRKFRSGEYSTSSQRPVLTVTYTNPTSSVSGYASQYRVGDKVTVTVRVNSKAPSTVSDIRLLINHSNGLDKQGYYRWTQSTTAGQTGWQPTWVSSETRYFSYATDSAYGPGRTTLLPMESSMIQGTDYRQARFVFRVEPGAGLNQFHDMDVLFYVDSGFNSGWKLNDTNIKFVADNPPVANASVNPTRTAPGSPVTFDATGSTDDVGVSGFAWDFDSDGVTDSVSPTATYHYPDSADWRWELKVVDTRGQKGVRTGIVEVRDERPDKLDGVEVETESDAWFVETDADSDGLADARNDSDGAGRGAVRLSWQPTARAQGYRIYLFDGALFRLVGETDGETTTWSSRGVGIWPSDSAIVTRTAEIAAGADPFAGGLDLRDDPRALYAATPGQAFDHETRYHFKVVPFHAVDGAYPLSQHPTATASLDKRTLRLDDAASHTVHTLGDVLGHDGEVVFDEGALELSVTDLEIASFGPRAALDRHYSSSRSGAANPGPGWVYSFERRVEASAQAAVYVDADGERHTFRALAGGGFRPEHGYRAELATTPAGGFALTYRDGTTLQFSSDGSLASERDLRGNHVRYDISEDVTITAANGQTISVDRDAQGRVLEAVHVTGDGTRRVVYAPGSVTAHPSTTDELTLDYAYAAGRLTSIATRDEVEGLGTTATWTFGYDPCGRPEEASAWAGQSSPSYLTFFAHGTGEATVTVLRDVDPATHSARLSQDTVARYEWHPTGASARRSVFRHVDDEGRLRAPFTYWAWTYTPDNDVRSEKTPLGARTTYLHDARGNVIETIDAAGGVSTTVWEADRPVTETDPTGAVTTRRYLATGEVDYEERTLDEGGARSRVEYSYDARGLLIEERTRIDADSWAVTAYSDHAASGEPQRVEQGGVVLAVGSDPETLTVTKGYDDFGNLVWERDATGRWVVKENVYSIAGRVVRSEATTGTYTHTTYNALGFVFETSTTAQGAAVDRRREVHDVRGLLTGSVRLNATGSIGAYAMHDFDAQGSILRQAPDGAMIRAQYDTSDPRLTVTAFDEAGRPSRIWAPGADRSADASATRISYDDEGRETVRIEAGADANHATTTTYDLLGRATRVENPDGTWVEYEYDALGRVTLERRPTDDGVTEKRSTYDLGGRLIETIDERGVRTMFSYDLAGRQRLAELDGRQAGTVYNALGWELSKTDVDGVAVEKAYDAAGRVLSESVAGRVTTFAYDGAGRLETMRDPDGLTTTTGYDAFSRVTSRIQTDAVGTTVKRTLTAFDEHNRVTNTTESVGSVTRSVDYAERTDTPSSSMLAYAGATTALTHDTATGLSTALSFSATDTAITGTIARDVRGYVTARALTGDASAAWGWTYDAAGRLTGQSGTGLSSGGATYEYGASGKKTGESIALAFGPARTSTFAYTPEGRLEQATIAGQTTRYSFDAAGNLDGTKRGTEPTVTLAYDTAGRIVSMGDVAFGFDEATGRRISAKRSGEESATYTWTEAGRLEHVSDPARGSSATHTYDGNGQRTTSVVRHGSVTTTTTWAYDGLTLLAYATERSDGATSALTYLTSEGGRPIAGVWNSSEASAPVRFSILTNDRGDVVALTDAAGEVFSTYGYDAFGAPRPDLTTSRETSAAPHAETIAAEQPLRYAGYIFDTHSGLYYCSQRYYDPQTMQFLTKDPARADGEESAYQYCGGDPVGKVDPTGLWAVGVVAAGGLLIQGIGWVELGRLFVVLGAVAAALTSGAIARAFRREYEEASKAYPGSRRYGGGQDQHGVRDWRVEHHEGQVHAHWTRANGQKGSVKKNGGKHDHDDKKPPKKLREHLKKVFDFLV